MREPAGRSHGNSIGQPRPPWIYTALDLTHVAPGPRLRAENGRFMTGLIVALPLSLGLWAALCFLALR